MAQLIVTIPDANLADVRDTLAVLWKYQPTIDDGNGGQIPNPQNKVQFLQSYISKFVKDSYKQGKAQAAESAVQAARDAADGVNIS